MKGKLTNKIKYYRFINNEMTQQELANKVGCTRQTMVALEQNKYSPSLILAFKIALVFDKPLEEVFEYEEKKES